MKRTSIDFLIQVLKDQQIPDCPNNLEANVLRQIRLSRSAQKSSLIFPSTRPQILAASVALLLGFTTAAGLSYSETKHELDQIEFAKVMDFSLFAPPDLSSIISKYP